MNHYKLLLLPCLLLSSSLMAADSFFCPENHAFINVGMSQGEVLNACGAPMKKEQSQQTATNRVPMTQMFYNQAGSPTAFYGVWQIPTGNNAGANLEVDVINNKVTSIRLNGSESNAFSICGGASIQIGDPVGKVLSTCGNPSQTNQTYINQPMEGNPRPEIWIYQLDPYQNTMLRLTFINGRLQSINQ